MLALSSAVAAGHIHVKKQAHLGPRAGARPLQETAKETGRLRIL